MNRSLKLSMLMALALGSSHVLAMDLGQVQVKSALGQPLLAEIPLRPADAAELKNLKVQLASGDEFSRAGVVGGRPRIPLHFSVVNGASGSKMIRVTSTVAVDDPYLDLLIEMNGSAGKSVREVAILLDPPGFNTNTNAGASAPAAAAATSGPAVTRAKPAVPARSAPVAKPAAPKPEPVARPAATASNGEYGPVAAGQTLSGIARSTAPTGVDLQQMMLALQQANPDAFYRNNINALKSGVVLRVPSKAEAEALTLAAALAEVRRQNSDWRARTPGKPALVADTATGKNASMAPTGKAGRVEDRLELVPAKADGAGSSGNNAGGKGDKSVASLRQDLLRARETTASLQQQSDDLKSRLKALSDINGENERLLSLKNNEIAELQSKLAEARKTAGLPAAAASAATKAVAPTTVSPAETAVAKAASVAPVASSSVAQAPNATVSAGAASGPAVASSAAAVVPAVAKAAAPQPKPAAKPIPKPAPKPMVEAPWYMQTWAWAAGGGVLLLLIVLGLRGRRGKPAAKVAASSLADQFGEAPISGETDSGDDVDQDELLDQLAEHPEDIDLHLELVTLYYSRRDVEHFEAAAEAMHAHITDPGQDEWQDVVHMGEDLVPAHPLFDHHSEAVMPGDAEPHAAFDIDDYGHDEHVASEVASSTSPLPVSESKKVSEYSFNFDLTRPEPADSGAGHQSAAADDATVRAASHDSSHAEPAPEGDWQAAGGRESSAEEQSFDITEFSDDPVDTKLDLARAYVDMGDADGARAMLGEVIKEGTQTQQDVAKSLLDTLS